MDLSAAPQPVVELADWLSRLGSPLRQDAYVSANNQVLRASTPRGTVQVLADRGQWFVELAPPGESDFFDSATWTACVSGSSVGLAVEPLEEQVTWLLAHLQSETDEVCSIECLQRARRRRAYSRMGLGL